MYDTYVIDTVSIEVYYNGVQLFRENIKERGLTAYEGEYEYQYRTTNDYWKSA